MFKYSLPFLLVIHFNGFSQRLKYTPLRAAFTLEGAGIGTTAMFGAEMPFYYRPRTFMNLQAGIGLNGDPTEKISVTYSGSITYNLLLNPYRQTECSPYPGMRNLEYYLETGFADTFEPGFGTVPNSRYSDSGHTPLGIAGIRIHIINRKWIYIVKLRYTPLINHGFSSWGGVVLGLGWRN